MKKFKIIWNSRPFNIIMWSFVAVVFIHDFIESKHWFHLFFGIIGIITSLGFLLELIKEKQKIKKSE